MSDFGYSFALMIFIGLILRSISNGKAVAIKPKTTDAPIESSTIDKSNVIMSIFTTIK